MSSIRYKCLALYKCPCYPGKVVSQRTTLRHRKDAQKRLQCERKGRSSAVPFPKRIDLSCLPSSPECSQAPIADLGELSPEAISLPRKEFNLQFESHRAASLLEEEHPEMGYSDEQPTVRSESPDSSTSTDRERERDGISVESPSDPKEDHGEDDIRNFEEVVSDRLVEFLEHAGWLVGFSLKHGASQEMMDDLLRKHPCPYRSWKGVKGAAPS